ncbi:glycosyltransferase [Nitriliruptoraceae bacterium ZYF776]|nr:glycosyltransferase [Profundirhabdus halotolerans]
MHAVRPRTAVRRVGVLSVHTSPLDQPGHGDGGGLNVSVAETSRRLADRGVHVDVFTRATDPSRPARVVAHRGRDGGVVEVHHLVAGPVAPVAKEDVANHLCAFLLGLERHPSAGTHDVLHSHYWLSGWVGRRLAARAGVPLVHTFHTLGLLKNAHLAPGDTAEPPLRLLAEAAVARDADRTTVLTCEEASLLHRAHGLSGQRISVVPAGVDLDRFSPAAAPRRDRPPTLLFVGRLQLLKGPEVAVRTLAAVREHVPGARLRIVGGRSGDVAGTDPAQLRALAAELGVADGLALEPAVPQRELAQRYRDSDVLLVPSRSETFGLVALEAQASGVPVVAADVPGLRAVVGDGGTLVPGHDPADHAAAVVAYLTDPARAAAAAEAGLARARAASWDVTVDRLLRVYAEVVGERRGQRDVADRAASSAVSA